jgi:hypothetical protein
VAIRLPRIVLLAALAAIIAPRAWAKPNILHTRSGSMVHWVGTDITIGFDRSTPSRTVSPEGAREALQAAVETWNGIPELPARFRLTTMPDPAVRVRFCRGEWTGDPDDLGRAVFTADIGTGGVRSATVEINECDRSFLAPDEAQDGRFDLQAVVTHELGHVLGLGHSDDPNALMYSRGGTAGVRTPKADERAAVALIYGPVSAPASHQPLSGGQLPPMSSEHAPIVRAMHNLDEMPPAEVVTAMRVAGNAGNALVVYTCEPTLLPPVSPVESDPDQKLTGRLGTRRSAHSAGHNPR